MGSLFDLDAPIWVWMTEVADVLILAILWWILCIPVVTIGASTTAMYYVLGKKVRKENVYVVKDFFKSFKENFRQSVPLTILMLITFTSAGLYIFMVIQGVLSGDQSGTLKWVVPVSVIFIFEAVNLFTYLWAILSRFDMKNKQLIKTTFIIMHKHLLTTFMITGVFVLSFILMLRIPFLLVLAPGFITAAISFLVQGLFGRYISANMQAQQEEVAVAEETSEVLEEAIVLDKE